MLLSKLVYLCVKNVVHYDDGSFTYESFLKGRFTNDPDYANSINNVYFSLNEAISRLNDLDRIPYGVATLPNVDGKPYTMYELGDLRDEIREIVAVAAFEQNGSVRPLNYIYVYGSGVVKIMDKVFIGDTIKIEYRREIPLFSDDDDGAEGTYFEYIYVPSLETEGLDVLDQSTDVELKDYGINDGMANYIIEYVRGNLLEQIDAGLANAHLSRAEQYFSNLAVVKSALAQSHVETVYHIGD